MEPVLPTTVAVEPTAPKDGTWPPSARRRAVFLIISAAFFMASVDQTIVATALPVLQRDLHARLDWGGWTITAYTLGQLLTLPVAGRASERLGRKEVFLGAVILFTASSLCCGLATNIYELVALRVVQSIGGGAFMPAATGLVTDLWGPDRDKAVGLFSSIFPIGGIAGPVLGGVLVGYWSWRGIFLINVPLGIALLVAGYVLIPARPPSGSDRPFDLPGIALLGTSLLAGMLGATYLGNPTHRGTDPLFLAAAVVSIAAGYLFVRHTRRVAAPLISPKLLYGPAFGAMNIINVVFGAAAGGFGALVAIYAQDRLHISALSSSTMLVARSVGMVVAAAIAVRLLRRTGVRRPMTLGYLIIVAGLLVILLDRPVLTPYTWVATGATLTGIGIGISSPASTNAAMQLAPNNAAAIAGLRGMFRQIGAITAVSVVTSVAARNGDPAHTLGIAFLVFAGIVLAVIPLIRRVPDHRGSW